MLSGSQARDKDTKWSRGRQGFQGSLCDKRAYACLNLFKLKIFSKSSADQTNKNLWAESGNSMHNMCGKHTVGCLGQWLRARAGGRAKAERRFRTRCEGPEEVGTDLVGSTEPAVFFHKEE